MKILKMLALVTAMMHNVLVLKYYVAGTPFSWFSIIAILAILILAGDELK